MRTYNKVILIGPARVTPELRQTKKGTNVTNFSLTTVDIWKDKATGELKRHTKWHKIVCWGRVAEKAVSVIKKGDIVQVEGSISYRKIADKDDPSIVRNVAEIKAMSLQKIANSRIPYSKPDETAEVEEEETSNLELPDDSQDNLEEDETSNENVDETPEEESTEGNGE